MPKLPNEVFGLNATQQEKIVDKKSRKFPVSTFTRPNHLPRNPSTLTCSNCLMPIKRTVKEGFINRQTHIVAALMTPVLLTWAPYAFRFAKDIVHRCPFCRVQLGVTEFRMFRVKNQPKTKHDALANTLSKISQLEATAENMVEHKDSIEKIKKGSLPDGNRELVRSRVADVGSNVIGEVVTRQYFLGGLPVEKTLLVVTDHKLSSNNDVLETKQTETILNSLERKTGKGIKAKLDDVTSSMNASSVERNSDIHSTYSASEQMYVIDPLTLKRAKRLDDLVPHHIERPSIVSVVFIGTISGTLYPGILGPNTLPKQETQKLVANSSYHPSIENASLGKSSKFDSEIEVITHNFDEAAPLSTAEGIGVEAGPVKTNVPIDVAMLNVEKPNVSAESCAENLLNETKKAQQRDAYKQDRKKYPKCKKCSGPKRPKDRDDSPGTNSCS